MNRNLLLVIGIALIALYVYQNMGNKKPESNIQSSSENEQSVVVQHNASPIEENKTTSQVQISQNNSSSIVNNQTEDQEPTYEPRISDPILTM